MLKVFEANQPRFNSTPQRLPFPGGEPNLLLQLYRKGGKPPKAPSNLALFMRLQEGRLKFHHNILSD